MKALRLPRPPSRPTRLAGILRPLRDPPMALLLAATAATLAAGWLLRARCVDLPSVYVPSLGCYSDVASLYDARQLSAHLVPYVQAFNEYPPLTALLQWLGALPTHTKAGYYVATSLLLAPVAFLLAWMLARTPEAKAGRIWMWAAAPPLALYAFLNWDLPAVALATGGLLAFRADRPLAAGLLLGLGFSAKWYPAVLGVVLLAALLGEDRTLRSPRVQRFAAGAAAGALVPHLAFLLAAPDGLADAYTFHLHRLPNGDSLRFLLSFTAERLGVQPIVAFDGALGLLFGILLAGGIAAAALQAWRGRLPPMQAALAALLVFLAFNKVYSPQYALWLLPLLILARAPWPLVVAFWVADLGAMTQLHHVFPDDPAEFPARYPLFATWSALRWACLLGLLAWAFRRPQDARQRLGTPGPAAEPAARAP